MSDTREKTERAITHPIEKVLDIEEGTTFLPAVTPVKTELVESPTFDEVDNQINEQFQEVYDTAMDAYEQQAMDIETIEPKYRARNQEVAVQYLNTALNAAKEKSSIKQFKDKLVNKSTKGGGIQNQQNNVIVGDRNDILRELFGDKHG